MAPLVNFLKYRRVVFTTCLFLPFKSNRFLNAQKKIFSFLLHCAQGSR
jgi:hypothetical protein